MIRFIVGVKQIVAIPDYEQVHAVYYNDGKLRRVRIPFIATVKFNDGETKCVYMELTQNLLDSFHEGSVSNRLGYEFNGEKCGWEKEIELYLKKL